MAKSVEVAESFLKKSIELAKEDPRYYMDFVKLHKLMYLGQCYINYHYGMNLFEEKIMAMDVGPYIKGIEQVVVNCGFGEIKNIDELKKYVLQMPLSFTRNETVDYILNVYGHYNTDEIVRISKNTIGWKTSYNESDDVPNEIDYILINQTGKQLFGDVNTYGTKSNCEHLCKIGECPKMRKKTKVNIK